MGKNIFFCAIKFSMFDMKKRLLFLIVLATVSNITPALCQTITVNLRVFLEGPFDGSGMTTGLNPLYIPLSQPYNSAPWNYTGTESVPSIPNSDVVDWVLVELRETAGDISTAYKDSVVATQSGFILHDGTIVSTDGTAPLSFDIDVTHSLYAVVYHRNHLAVMSGGELTMTAGVYSYDFTTSAAQAYGGLLAQKESALGIWMMVAGDGDGNGQVNNLDKNDVWAVQAGQSGYLAGDFDMNGQVNNGDKNDLWIINGGRSSQIIGSWECGKPIVDARDGKQYSTVQIGTQCWMAENLNTGTMIQGGANQTNNGIIEKYCYNNNPSNCATYGGLYQWNEMMDYTVAQGTQGICPSGWHIPSDNEWKTLEGTVDSQYGVGNPIWNTEGWRGFDVGKNLKSTSGWSSGGNGVNLYGFGALPGGVRDTNGSFLHLAAYASWWSSDEYSGTNAWHRYLVYYKVESYRDNFSKMRGFSVRCLRN